MLKRGKATTASSESRSVDAASQRAHVKPLPLASVRELQVESDGVEVGVTSLIIVKAVVHAARATKLHYPFPELRGLDLEALDDPALGISRGAFEAMLEQLVLHSGDDALGLALGASLSGSHFHFVGPIVLGCVSGQQAIDLFLQLRRTILGGPAWSLQRSGSEARLGHPTASTQGARTEAELGITIAYRMAAEFWGEWVRPDLRVEFAFPAPHDLGKFTTIFGSAVTFDAKRSCLVMPTALLDYERPEADRNFAATLLAFARAHYLDSQARRSWTRMVRLALSSASSLQDTDVERVAANWLISGRTLRRKLELEATTFKAIREEVRFERAVQMLKSQAKSIEQIAEELGYGEPNSFRRAFKKWSGQSPSTFRSVV
jgi:AraC-like DNA-binding protein